MTSWLDTLTTLKAPVLAVVLCVCLLLARAEAQQPPQDNAQLKEVQIAAGAFSLADPVPSWVEPVAIPEANQTHPVVLRLADNQYLIDDAPVIYVRPALMVNDGGSLSGAGQISIPFVPQYHKLQLHAVRIFRKGESLDRTASSTVR